ncbi:hypothetical protein TSUD_67200 [Trifolium subterraneum]|uniref:Uncharacterized protein n=1 Tax=Trifolium subterraneum TaxID=3900 RepID=A0A2Z6NE47_TRISU|nr:hypothetical protein TSUD_67200 [Trifolium subterraneum]
MRRFLLKNASLYTRNLLHHSSSTTAPLAVSSHSRFCLFSSNTKPATIEKPSIKGSAPIEIEDVDNKEFKAMLDKYFKDRDEQMLPEIMEAILKRRLSGKHEDTDDELLGELADRKPIDDVEDEDFENDFEEMHETDDEIDDLYNARDIVMERMVKR